MEDESIDYDELQNQLAEYVRDHSEEEQESRFISTVPLSSTGISPAEQRDLIQQEIEERERSQQAMEDAIQDELEFQRAKPTSAFQRAKEVYSTVAETVGRRNSEASRHTIKQKSRAYSLAQKDVEQAYEKKDDPIHENNVRIMNRYREVYKDRIDYKFKSNYTYSMDKSYIVQSRREVEVLLATVNLPVTLKDALVKATAVVQYGSIWAGFGHLFHKATHDVKINTDMGYFDEEIEQLAIIWGDYLSVGPGKRLFSKWAMVVSNSASNVMLDDTTPESPDL